MHKTQKWKAEDNNPKRADYALKKTQTQKLYEMEREAREQELSFEERNELRQKKSAPVLAEMATWMRNQLTQVLPKKSTIGEAIFYKDVLTQIPNHSIQKLEELLPGYQPEKSK